MNPLLRPRPMTAAQIADLVERAKVAGARVARNGSMARVSSLPTIQLRARCAARFRTMTRCTVREAAHWFRVSESSVDKALKRNREAKP